MKEAENDKRDESIHRNQTRDNQISPTFLQRWLQHYNTTVPHKPTSAGQKVRCQNNYNAQMLATIRLASQATVSSTDCSERVVKLQIIPV